MARPTSRAAPVARRLLDVSLANTFSAGLPIGLCPHAPQLIVLSRELADLQARGTFAAGFLRVLAS